MTRLKGITACLGVLALMALLATPARANLQVEVIDFYGTHVFTDVLTPGSIIASAVDLDFSYSLQIASSNSPGAGYASVHIDSIVQATAKGVTDSCTLCDAGYNLMVIVSDNAFHLPIGSFLLTQSVNTNTISTSPATGMATFNGYEVNGGAIFATGPNRVGPTTFTSFAVTNNATQSSGPFTTTDAFTLTEDLGLKLTDTSQGQATSNLSIGAVPEPASILLFGTVLLGLGSLLRKRTAAPKS